MLMKKKIWNQNLVDKYDDTMDQLYLVIGDILREKHSCFARCRTIVAENSYRLEETSYVSRRNYKKTSRIC